MSTSAPPRGCIIILLKYINAHQLPHNLLKAVIPVNDLCTPDDFALIK